MSYGFEIPGYDPAATAPEGAYFDEEAALRSVQFFPMFTTHVKGELAGQPFELEPWQQCVNWNAFGWMNKDGNRRYREIFLYVPRKNGKALDCNTPVLSSRGWVKHGDLEVGDDVYTPSGEPTKITEVHPPINDPMMTVTFSNGDSIVCHPRHEWEVWDKWRQKIVTRETQDMVRDFILNTSRDHVERRYRIAVSKPALTPRSDLPIDPYLLGAWLGDGTSAQGAITCADPEINDEILRRGYRNTSIGDYKGKTALTYRYEGLKTALRINGILNNKHIPENYLSASFEQRLDLLKGLMDTDGCVSKRGQCEYTTVLKDLAYQVQVLVSSVGLKATVLTHRATLYGKDCGPKYRVLFHARQEMPVFRLARKNIRLTPTPKRPSRSCNVTVVDIAPAGIRESNCITVDSPEGMYCVGNTHIPTHNSTWCAGLALEGLMLDEEPGAEVYSLAADREQARLVFDQAKVMALKDPTLKGMLKAYQHSIAYLDTNSSYKPLSAEASTKHGFNTHFAVIDEVHTQPNRELVEVIQTSTGARRQPMIWYITTADYSRDSICNELYDYAKKVRDGIIDDPTFLPVIYEATLEDDWTDPDIWYKANPNLGVSVKEEYIARQCKKAQENPAYENTFKRLHLNIQTEQDKRWIPMADWNICADEIPEDLLLKSPCWGGIDLSTVSDLSCFALFWPEFGASKLWSWLPEEQLNTKRGQLTYQNWVDSDHICLTPGTVIDYEYIRHEVNAQWDHYNVQDVGCDPWNATHFLTLLTEEDGRDMVLFRQGFASMNEPSKMLERLVKQHSLHHGDNPVLNWMASNVFVKEDPAGNIKPTKDTNSTAKIDGIVALIMAIGRAHVSFEELGSVYSTRGILTL